MAGIATEIAGDEDKIIEELGAINAAIMEKPSEPV